MMNLTRKIISGTKENLAKMSNLKLWVIILIGIITCIQFFMPKDQAMAASGIKIYNYTAKSEYTYTDAQIKVTYNGKKISVDSTPGILQNGIALVSYKDIFANSAINAKCVYDKKAGTVSISKYGITIVMTIGSKTAYINGKKVTAPLAPVKIKYVKANVTKILVPSRFISENLGFKYTWYKDTSTVAIEMVKTPILLSYNDGEPFYYTGAQGKVTIDQKAVDLGDMPSIIISNTAMLRAKKVFSDSAIGAEYKYNSSDKTITLSRNGNVLKMKIGSPVAELNGNSYVLDVAPVLVTNYDTGTSYVMVPGSFTATCLGFDYRWDNNNITSVITSRKDSTNNNTPETVPGQNQGSGNATTPGQGQSNTGSSNQSNTGTSNQSKEDAPELGDDSVKWDPGKIQFQWEAQKSKLGTSSGVKNIDNSTKEDKTGLIFSVARDYTKDKINSETYAIYGNVPITKATSTAKGNQILLNISNLNTMDYTYNMQNQSDGILDNVRAYTVDTYNSRLEFNLTSDKFAYDISLSPDKYTLYITIYHNSLIKITIGTNSTMDYITLTGNYPLNTAINKNSNIITIDIQGSKNGIEDQTIVLLDALNLYYASVFHSSYGTHISLCLKDSSLDYYIAENDNSYTVMIPANDKAPAPVVPKETDSSDTKGTNPAQTEYPDANTSYEIVIPNPSGIKVSQIEDEDQYDKLRFSIRLPGDYVSYLNNYPIKVSSSAIKDVSVFLNSKNQTEILVSTTKIQGYKLYADSNYIYVKVGNPKDIYKNIVVLDPGHGGSAPGAHYFNTYEKTLNFKILYEIGKDLFNSDPDKLKVYYTRVTDVDVSLDDRAAFAQKVGADLFVSLHMNASTDSSIYGTEVYYSSSNNKPNKAGLNSETLAKLFVNNLSNSLNTLNRGTRSAKYVVVHRNTVPAVLIELGFLSCKKDFTKLSDYEFQYKAAKVLYETLLQVFELYPTGR